MAQPAPLPHNPRATPTPTPTTTLTSAILFVLEITRDMLKDLRAERASWTVAKPRIDAAIWGLRLASDIEPGVTALQEGRLRRDIRKGRRGCLYECLGTGFGARFVFGGVFEEEEEEEEEEKKKEKSEDDSGDGGGSGSSREEERKQVLGEPAVVSERRLCGSAAEGSSGSGFGRRRRGHRRYHPYGKAKKDEGLSGYLPRMAAGSSGAEREEATTAEHAPDDLELVGTDVEDIEDIDDSEDGNEAEEASPESVPDDNNTNADTISINWTSSFSHALSSTPHPRTHSLGRAVPILDPTPYRSALRLWGRRNADARDECERWMRYAMDADEQVEAWRARALREEQKARSAVAEAGVWRERCRVWEREALRLMEVVEGEEMVE